MWKRIIALLLIIPLVDALVLVVFAGVVGWQLTVALVVLTALVGLMFARLEARLTMRKIQDAIAVGRAPTAALIDGGLLIAAGAFLLTPGLVTDAIGLLLIIPPTRVLIRTVLHRYVIIPYLDRQSGGFATGTVYTRGFPGADDGQPITINRDDDPDRE